MDPDRDHLALLQHAEELHLGGRRHLTDLVEEECPTVGGDEEALLVLHRSGEGALHMTEELAFEEALGECTAVDRVERAGAALAERVDPARHDLLARPALTREEDGRVGGRDRLGELHHLGEGTCLTDRSRRARDVPRADLLLELPVLPLERPCLGGSVHDREQLLVLERLLEVVVRALVDRLHRRLKRRLCRHEDHRDLGVDTSRRGEHVESARTGHPYVAEHDVGALLLDEADRVLTARGGVNVEAALTAEEDPQRLEDPLLVVDEEERRRRVPGTFLHRGAHADTSFSVLSAVTTRPRSPPGR